MFSRAKQVEAQFNQISYPSRSLNILIFILYSILKFTEEKLGRTERTEYEQEYQELEKKTDLTKSYTEKIKNNTAAVIVPNPGNIN